MPELEKITEGATAEIFAWEDNRILKLFFDFMGSGAAQHEADVTNAVVASGFPAPAAYEVVQVNGREGIVYERFDGETLVQLLRKRMWRGAALMRNMAEVHADMHTHQASDILPLMHASLEAKIANEARLSEAVKSRLLAHLETLPVGNVICHGDFHPLNIIYTPSRLVVIDWVDAKAGHPHADVARTMVILSERPTAKDVGWLLSMTLPFLQKRLVTAYLRHYCSLTHSTAADVQRWLPLMAAARLRESSAKHEQLLQMIQQWYEKNI